MIRASMVLDWAEKHRPRTLAEVVGNPEALKALRAWADSWGADKKGKRAAILHGRPGVGKTTAAHALAREKGWEVVELNASDQRNADAIEGIALRGAIGETFAGSGEFRSRARGEMKLIILDEADNVFGKEDRGGYRAIINMVASTMHPVVLIANDFYELVRKAGPLRAMCQEIRFYAPRQQAIARRLGDVARLEGFDADPKVLSAIADRCGGDVRSAINDLQTMLTGSKVADEGGLAVLGARDVQLSPFDAVRRVIHAKDFRRARDAAMDTDEEPANFLTWVEQSAAGAFDDPRDRAAAYESLARADLFLARASKLNAYVFWSYATDMMTAGVGLPRKGQLRQGFKIEFPSWLRMMSASKGQRGVRRAVGLKLARYTHSSSREILSESLPMYATIFRGKESMELRRRLAESLALSEEEIAYLLDVKVGSEEAAKALQERRRREPEERRGTEGDATEKPQEPAQRTLVSYDGG
jgi:replication factor C large subunit